MRQKTKTSARVIAAAAGLGAVAGVRSMTAPALLSWAGYEGWAGTPRVLRQGRMVKVLSALAVGEIIADKTPYVPNRTAPASLAWRIASGALVGGALCASKHKPAAIGMLAGGLGALAATYGAFHLRHRIAEGMSDKLVAVAEDAIAVGGGALLIRAA
jgi:uncharacterized membrane protein